MSALYRALELTRRSGATQQAAAPIAEAAAMQAAAAIVTSKATEQRVRTRTTKRRLRLAMMACLPAVALLAFYGVDQLTTPEGAKSLSAELAGGIGLAVTDLIGSAAPAPTLPLAAAPAPAVQPMASEAPIAAPAPQPAVAAAAPVSAPAAQAPSSISEPPPLMAPIAVAPMTPADARGLDVLDPSKTAAAKAPVQAEAAPEPLSPLEVAAALRTKPPKSPLAPSEIQKTLERAVSGERQTLASLGMLGPSEPVRIERSAAAKSMPQISVTTGATPDRGSRLDRYKSAHNAMVTGDLPLSASLYQEILRDSPTDATALFGLASAQHRLGRDGDARASYDRLLKIDPDNEGAMANMLALLGRAEPTQALAQLEDMRKNLPNSAAVVAQLAGLYASQGMLDRAIANAKQAIELAPENLFYLYNLAILHDRAGRGREAAVAYREVLQRVGGGEAGGLSLPVADIQSRLAYLSQ